MSLLVEVFVREPDGRRRILDVPDDVHRSGGFESWRTTVRGSEFVRSLGARFLPVPAREGPSVEAEDVPEFPREVALLRSRPDEVAHGTRRPRTVEEHRDQIECRPGIIEESIRKALELGGGVLVRWARTPRRRPRQGGCPAGGGGRFGKRGCGVVAPPPGSWEGRQPISSSDLPFVSFTNLRTKGMESAAKTV
ncbi:MULTISPECIES: hypothetical protein [Streptomyces]|uniref:Uncharacterized protein n=1 Tax=Streptomyces scabiei TaxID=1930 RepID=A0A100JT56_STRSC|nr:MULTISPECIES: hypothetical protein [Streptomyces]MDX3069491.1 hypothetical protein [Streptomyces sp. ND04-05B]GAQ65218.1 hypothetical protein SsS58_05627 [Streptomyces scabiei]